MNSLYTAAIKQDANWWIGWIKEVPGINCQESSREKLLMSLRETLTEAIELNRSDAEVEFSLVEDHIELRVRNAPSDMPTSGFGMLKSKKAAVPADFDPASLLRP